MLFIIDVCQVCHLTFRVCVPTEWHVKRQTDRSQSLMLRSACNIAWHFQQYCTYNQCDVSYDIYTTSIIFTELCCLRIWFGRVLYLCVIAINSFNKTHVCSKLERKLEGKRLLCRYDVTAHAHLVNVSYTSLPDTLMVCCLYNRTFETLAFVFVLGEKFEHSMKLIWYFR